MTLLAEQPTATGLGVDLSEAACLQASANAVLHRVEARADIRQSDWFQKVEGQFDLIVSNPPYIALEEMPGLSAEVRNHEPEMALTDGGDGLGAYRRIVQSVDQYLKPSGRILVEIGPTQATAVAALFEQAGLRHIRVVQDLDGRDRVVCAQDARGEEV